MQAKHNLCHSTGYYSWPMKMQKHAVCQHQTHGSSWRTHWDWKHLSNVIHGGTLRINPCKNLWIQAARQVQMDLDNVLPHHRQRQTSQDNNDYDCSALERASKSEICLPFEQWDIAGEYSYLWSDKHLPTRQTWRSWFSLTAVFSLQKKKKKKKRCLKVKTPISPNIIFIISNI